MSDEPDQAGALAVPKVSDGAWVSALRDVDVQTLAKPRIYEVMEQDLDALVRDGNEASQSLGVLTFMAGVLVSSILAIVGMSTPTPMQMAVAMGIGLVAAVESARSWFKWRQATSQTSATLARIKRTYRVVPPTP